MSAKTDQAKGRIKEAVGALTDNKDLRKEGKADQKVSKEKLVGEAKKALDDAKDASTCCDSACD
jgi:uncharacterized protein YjbJ (UPF0337 family)